MNCPACRRDNHPARRYCGGCGCNFEPACAACGFANDRADRYCGGCGEPLRAAARHLRAAAAPRAGAPAAPPPAAVTSSVWEASELAELFTPPAAPDEASELPEAGINQSDVDRLFGGSS